MHLFDMLRDRRLFPSNLELVNFAVRILPNIPRGRLGKISRPEIAARIVEYLETLGAERRATLEASMREAMTATPETSSERSSFFTKWERIIKGIDR
jgi:hypothetical protein